MDQVKVPMFHSYKKSNYVFFREEFFAWNATMHAKVNNLIMKNEGMSESQIEMHLCHNVSWWLARVHR